MKMSIKVFKERGLLSLFFRVTEYVFEFLKAIFFGPGDVLYVSGCPGGSRFYRCYNQAEELAQFGIKAKVISQDNIGLKWITKKYKLFIFQRVIYNDHIEKIISDIKKQDKPILFETDDLVFDPEYLSSMHYYNHMSKQERGWYENGIGREILEDPFVSHCIVSTKYLAKALNGKYSDKTVFVSKNKMNSKQVEYAESALERKAEIKPNDGKIKIGYFSGSKSHDNDFDTISDVLIDVLGENKNVVLMIVGHLKLDDKFNQVAGQIEYHNFVPMKKLPQLMLCADINIAPLEIDNPFCQGKSELKFFEAGLLGIPTIASATESFKDAITDQKDGMLAENEEQWREKLLQLIENQDLRNKIGEATKKTAIEKYTTLKIHPETQELADFIKKSYEQKQ